jgi:hypothetical protein
LGTKFAKDANSIKERILSKNRELVFQHSGIEKSDEDIKISTLSPRHCYLS